ncbi:tetratricopeptide repeat protein [Dapis sp. BLCC M126]|uniref:tetratricopeptide repeat protein n=1 Tax=Dapis sp. BLCC M126 TaxID=3400189 RepID=UPI003CEBD85E
MSLNQNSQSLVLPKQQEAEIYLSQGKLEAAYEICQSILADSPNFAPAYNTQGKVLQAMGKIESAITSYRQAIQLNPQHIETYTILGDILIKQKQLSETIACYETAIKHNPKVSFFHHKLGLVFMQLKNWDEAVNYFCRAIQFNPNFPWSYYKLGEALTKQKKWHQAVVAYQRTIEIKPDLYWSYQHLGNALIKQGKIDEAIAYYQDTLQRQPHLDIIHKLLADVLVEKDEIDAAITNYLKAIQLNPDSPWSHICLWEILLKKNQWDEAIITYQEAIKLNPNAFWLWTYLGNALVKQGNLERAITCYQKALKIQPEIYEVHKLLGDAFVKNDRWEAAANSYLQAISINPEISWADSGLSILLNVLHKTNKLDEAAKLYQKKIELNPQSILTYINLGQILTSQEKIDEATICYQTACYQKILKSHPNFVEKHWNLEQFQKAVRKPDFLIIGVGKGGTTSLYTYLTQHPQVLPPLLKEINFWSGNFEKGINWYLSHFPPIPKSENYFTGEASPGYFGNLEAATRIFSFFPKIKLIILLRNPIDRAISHYYHWVRLNKENRSLETAINYELEILQNFRYNSNFCLNHWQQNLYYLAPGFYIKFLEKWMAIFRKEQFLILKTEDFNTNPVNVMQQVLKFLDLPDYQIPDYQKLNVGSYPDVKDAIRQKMSDFFQDSNQKLEEYLDMKFHWETWGG